MKLSMMKTTELDKHINKLVDKYDTTGNRRNFILVYAKVADFAALWQQYQAHFDDFDLTDDSDKSELKTGVSHYHDRELFHLFINLYSAAKSYQ